MVQYIICIEYWLRADKPWKHNYQHCAMYAFEGFSRTLDERYNYNPKKCCSM